MKEKRSAIKQKILIADDSEMNREILKDMLGEDYLVLEAVNGVEAVASLWEHEGEIDLLLLDITMPEMDGFGVLEAMHHHGWNHQIPVIMITAENDSVLMERAYELGVADYIRRPFDALMVQRRVTNTLMLYGKQKMLMQMVANQVYEREKISNLMVTILSHIVEFRNGESGQHVIHIQTVTEFLCRHLALKTDQYPLSPADISLYSSAAALHDIGKISIPQEILNKPGKLTPEEFAIMKTHSAVGASMLESLPASFQKEPLVKAAHEICRWHHERWDGKGYPDGLKGEEIPISAQIVSLADVYDALTSERCYKKAFSHEKAIEMITNGECGTFHPLLLECLSEVADSLYQELQQVNEDPTAPEALPLHGGLEELLREQEISTPVHSVQLMEQEWEKIQFFASNSEELRFDYDVETDMVILSDYGSQVLGMKRMISKPHQKEQAFLGKANIQKLIEALHQTTADSPEVQLDLLSPSQESPRWYRVIARGLWSQDNLTHYTRVVGKIIDIQEEHSGHVKPGGPHL